MGESIKEKGLITLYKDERKGKKFLMKSYPYIETSNFKILKEKDYVDLRYLDSIFHYILF